MSKYSQCICYSQAEWTHFGIRLLTNFGLGLPGHFVLKNSTYKNRQNLHVIIAFQW